VIEIIAYVTVGCLALLGAGLKLYEWDKIVGRDPEIKWFKVKIFLFVFAILIGPFYFLRLPDNYYANSKWFLFDAPMHNYLVFLFVWLVALVGEGMTIRSRVSKQKGESN